MTFKDLEHGCAMTLKQNLYKLCNLMQAARMMTCEGVLIFVQQDGVSMNGANKYLGQIRRS